MEAGNPQKAQNRPFGNPLCFIAIGIVAGVSFAALVAVIVKATTDENSGPGTNAQSHISPSTGSGSAVPHIEWTPTVVLAGNDPTEAGGEMALSVSVVFVSGNTTEGGALLPGAVAVESPCTYR